MNVESMSEAERRARFGALMAVGRSHNASALNAMRSMERNRQMRMALLRRADVNSSLHLFPPAQAGASADFTMRAPASLVSATMPHVIDSTRACEARLADTASRLRRVLPQLFCAPYEPLLRFPQAHDILLRRMLGESRVACAGNGSPPQQSSHSEVQIAGIVGDYVASARRQVDNELQMRRLQAMRREHNAAATTGRVHHAAEQGLLWERTDCRRTSQHGSVQQMLAMEREAAAAAAMAARATLCPIWPSRRPLAGAVGAAGPRWRRDR